MTAPVLLPACLVRLGAERLLFPVTNGLDSVRGDPSRNQRVLHRAGAIVAECEVVLGRSAFVAVALNGEADIGMLLQERDICLNRRLFGRANVGLVVVE